MSQTTSIEWTATVNADGTVTPGSTWNPFRGCSRVSPGCARCYAETIAARFSDEGQPFHLYAERTPKPHWTGKVGPVEKHLNDPMHWKKPRKVFVNSMSDLFHEELSITDQERVFRVMFSAPQHTYQILTKRADIMAWRVPIIMNRIFGMHWKMPDFIWLGVSVENQEWADKRIPYLLNTPAAVRFVSYEPALDYVDFSDWLSHNPVYEVQGKREVCIPIGAERRLGDPSGRNDLANQKTGMGSLETVGGESSMQESARGTRLWRISSGSGDDRQIESLFPGTSIGVHSSKRTNPGWADDQSRGRQQKEQPSEQSGTGDAFRADETCLQDRIEIPVGSDESRVETERRSGCEDPSGLRSGKPYPSPDRRQVWGGTPNDIENSSGRSSSDAGWANGRLRDQEKQSESPERCEGALSLIIVGGESGPGARRFDIGWAEETVKQCKANGVACFVKQLGAKASFWSPGNGWVSLGLKDKKGGSMEEWPVDIRVREFPTEVR